MPESFVFTRLHLPRHIDPDVTEQLALRLMGSDVPRPLSLEIHATKDGLAHVLGCPVAAVQRLKRLLRGFLPEVAFEAATRPDVANTGRIAARPGGLPLNTADPEPVASALYAALASRRGSEHVAVQLVLGRAHRPAQTPPKITDPLQPIGARLLDGARTAPPEVRRRLQEHQGHPRLDISLRIGVSTQTPKRRRALTWEMFGAFESLQSPGVRLTLLRDHPDRWRRCVPAQSGLRLTPPELGTMLGWPVGERDYPGVPALHPRRLPVPEIVSRTDSVFAVGTAPGPERHIGIDPTSRLQHMVALGPTGSGKSTLLEHLILSDITAGRACVVLEPKRQLIDSILERAPAESAGQIIVLDPADTEPVGFNPLESSEHDDPYVLADNILAALRAIFEEGWGPRTEYLIQGALLTLLIAGRRRGEPYTLIDLPTLFTDTPFRRAATAHVTDDPTLVAFWAEYEEARPAQRANMIAAPLNKLRKLVMRKNLRAVLGQPSPRFRLRDVFRERKTVLIPLNEALIGSGAATLLGSLIVAELFMATQERASEKHPAKRPGMVFIDEVQNYLHLPTPLDAALAMFRSYGVGLHLAHQYRKQLSPTMRAAFDSNARSKVCFALEEDDARDMARQAPALSAEDFQTLPVYEIYTRLIAGSIPAGWCSARALPPAPMVGAATQIRAASRAQYGRAPTAPEPVAVITLGASTPAGTRPSHQRARRA